MSNENENEKLSPGRALARSLARSDGWGSVMTGIGLLGRDKTKTATHKTIPLSHEEAEDLWRGDDMAAKAVERVPEEMLREGFTVHVRALEKPEVEGIEGDDPELDPNLDPELDPELEGGEPENLEGKASPEGGEKPEGEPGAKKPTPEEEEASRKAKKRDGFGGPPGGGFGGPPPPPKPPGVVKRGDGETKEIEEGIVSKLEELKLEERLYEALCMERGLGGSAILIGADDGVKNLRMPLDLDRIAAVRFLTVLSARELTPVEYFSDPLAPNYGEPSIWRIQPQGVPAASGSVFNSNEVHATRLIIFPGIRISRMQLQSQNGWGDSVLVRMHKILSDFGMSWGGAAILMADFAQAVMKINGLAELIATDQDEVVIRRAQTVDMTRSIARMILIDGENEEFERKSTSLAGFPEMLDRFATRFAAAADMPVTLLMGQAPAGLNATGASDIRSFYDRCASGQRKKLKPAIERLIRLIMLSKEGPTKGIESEAWGIEFAPLYQLTSLEEATRRKTVAETDAIYLTNSVVTPEEIAASRFGGDKYSPETVIDFEGREELAAEHVIAEEDHAAASEEAKKEAAKNPPPGFPPKGGPPAPAGKPSAKAPPPGFPPSKKAPPTKKDNAPTKKAPARRG